MICWTTRAAVAALLVIGGSAAHLGAARTFDTVTRGLPACTAEQGQYFLDTDQYVKAIKEFSCVIDAQPTGIDGYRGRIEAELLLGRFSDAVSDYTLVTAYVVPVHPDAGSVILEHYAGRLAGAPNDVKALTGASFARWWLFDYAQAIQLLHTLLDLEPDDLYGNLFRGSSRVLRGATPAQGIADLERAIALAPGSPDVRFIVADAYTYGQPDPERALAEATFALEGGLDTPRVHAILAAAYDALGDLPAAAMHIDRHLDLVTTDLVATAPLAINSSMSLPVVPGRTYEVPVTAAAGQTLSLGTSSQLIWDTILLVVDANGTPIVGNDDDRNYYAGLEWVVPETGTYFVRVTSFEAAYTGDILITRK